MNKSFISVLLLIAIGCGGGKKMGIKTLPPPIAAPPPPPRRVMELDPSLHASAAHEILDGIQSNDPLIRANAIEAAQDCSLTESFPAIVSALPDHDGLVRFAACMAIGQLQIHDALQQLQQMLNDPDDNVKVGVRFALHMLGDSSHTHDLELYARSPNRSVRANVALVLGLMKEPSARRLLVPMLNDPDPAVRLGAAAALWQLHDERGLNALVVVSVGGYVDELVVSMLGLAAPGDVRVLPHIRAELISDPKRHDQPAIGLVAARAMGMLGSDGGYTIAANGAASADPRLRALAALALGAIGRSDAQPILAPLLKDSSQPVRLAAATAILELKAG